MFLLERVFFAVYVLLPLYQRENFVLDTLPKGREKNVKSRLQ